MAGGAGQPHPLVRDFLVDLVALRLTFGETNRQAVRVLPAVPLRQVAKAVHMRIVTEERLAPGLLQSEEPAIRHHLRALVEEPELLLVARVPVLTQGHFAVEGAGECRGRA